jgi:hypothetical protein
VRFIAGLLLIGLLVVIGIGAYNAGVSAGLAETGAAVASGAPVVYYGPYIGHPYGWGGFGFFGFLFGILLIFLIFGLIRAAFGFGRWGRGGRDWGNHHGPGGRGGYLDDWHRRAHAPADETKSS